VSGERPSYEIAHCIVCGQRDAVVVAEAEDFRAELEALWEYHAARLRPDTPPARLADRVTFSQAAPFRLVRCSDCGLVYRNPIEREFEVRELYARDEAAREGLEALHASQLPAARAQARRVRRMIGRGGQGLELGSYVGAFLVAAKDAGLHFEGLDVNSSVNAFVREKGTRVHDGELRDLPNDHAVDALAIWNTFDQLTDPRSVTYEAWRRLRPRGLLAIRVPNGAVYANLHSVLSHGDRVRRRAARAVLAQNNLLGFPYRWGFTIESLRRLLADAGFTVAHTRGDVLVPTSDEWTRPWARWEERMLKRAMAVIAHARPAWAPWLEFFAIRGQQKSAGERRQSS
jgi:SAM-dependent methyltransferase